MCKDCLVEVRPDRGTTCLEEGHYLLNFKACAQCGHRASLSTSNRVHKEIDDDATDADEQEETISFEHTCGGCKHVVCEHFYSFRIEETTQEYLMDCFLCGNAADCVIISSQQAVAYHYGDEILETGDAKDDDDHDGVGDSKKDGSGVCATEDFKSGAVDAAVIAEFESAASDLNLQDTVAAMVARQPIPVAKAVDPALLTRLQSGVAALVRKREEQAAEQHSGGPHQQDAGVDPWED